MIEYNNLTIEDNIPWTEKYRPKHFNNIISHTLIKDIIIKTFQKIFLPR